MHLPRIILASLCVSKLCATTFAAPDESSSANASITIARPEGAVLLESLGLTDRRLCLRLTNNSESTIHWFGTQFFPLLVDKDGKLPSLFSGNGIGVSPLSPHKSMEFSGYDVAEIIPNRSSVLYFLTPDAKGKRLTVLAQKPADK